MSILIWIYVTGVVVTLIMQGILATRTTEANPFISLMWPVIVIVMGFVIIAVAIQEIAHYLFRKGQKQ